MFKDILGIFLTLSCNVCCVYSLESHRRCNSNEYTRHTIYVIDMVLKFVLGMGSSSYWGLIMTPGQESNRDVFLISFIEDRKDIPELSHLLSELELWLTLSGSNYPCLETVFMVPKKLEPLKFDCMLIFPQRGSKWLIGLYSRKLYCHSWSPSELS